MNLTAVWLRWLGIALIFLPPALLAQTPPEIDMQWGAKIALRDGVQLNATVIRPHGQKDPLPAIFTLTPYVADSYLDRAVYFAQHGYVYALVDVRGRGNSGGAFEPFANEPKDGHDVVEWLAKQPWCNGKVAMWGGSYAGFDQWATLKEFPPHLSTIVPAAAAHPGVDFPFTFGIFAPYDMQWLSFTSGATSNANLFGNSAYWRAKAGEYYDQHLAFQDYDKLVGNPSPVFRKWLQHPTRDAYYDAMVPDEAAFKRINVPILTITGHYDGDQPGAFTYYQAHMRYGTVEAKQNHFLIIGPWDHAGTRTPKKEVGGLSFGDASLLDLNKLHVEWYDWTMKGGAKPAFLKKRVAYYVVTGTNAGEWKYADTLEAISNDSKTLYLTSNGGPNDVFHSGILTEAKSNAATSTETSATSSSSSRASSPVVGSAMDTWTYDPLNTKPGDLEPADDPNALVSQTAVLNLFGEGVVYHSTAFPDATEISGFPRLTVWLTMNVPDTDLYVNLYEVLSDGSSVQLSGALMRARYRDSLREAKPVPVGKAEKYVFENFTFFSRRVAKGSRLRLVVGSNNSTGTEKNYNGGGDVALETAKDARTAEITLLHDQAHPSALELPIVKP
jgi:putative CocE/NonD family hydrolase